MFERINNKVVIRLGFAVVFALFCLLVAEDIGAWIHVH
jgi:hypothetical protein